MDHRDHVALIRGGLEDARARTDGPPGEAPRWLELGAGDGEFTLALADLLGPGASIVALDRDATALRRLEDRVRSRFPGTRLATVEADFQRAIPTGPFDGVLAANSLHFVADPVPVLGAIHDALRPGGRLVLVEYDAEDGNAWVPYPISQTRFGRLAPAAGFTAPTPLHRVPSRFLGAIHAALAIRP